MADQMPGGSQIVGADALDFPLLHAILAKVADAGLIGFVDGDGGVGFRDADEGDVFGAAAGAGDGDPAVGGTRGALEAERQGERPRSVALDVGLGRIEILDRRLTSTGTNGLKLIVEEVASAWLDAGLDVTDRASRGDRAGIFDGQFTGDGQREKAGSGKGAALRGGRCPVRLASSAVGDAVLTKCRFAEN